MGTSRAPTIRFLTSLLAIGSDKWIYSIYLAQQGATANTLVWTSATTFTMRCQGGLVASLIDNNKGSNVEEDYYTLHALTRMKQAIPASNHNRAKVLVVVDVVQSVILQPTTHNPQPTTHNPQPASATHRICNP
jgi:hypothetical protein